MNIAQLHDVDGFDTTAATVSALHALGKYVVCYFSAGTTENWRPDASQFPASVVGSADPGRQGENYVDIRRPIVRQIMAARMDMCKSKGFYATDPDNVDAYKNKSGFPLTASDQSSFNNDGSSSVSASTFTSTVCPQDKGTLGFVPILKNLALDAPITYCP